MSGDIANGRPTGWLKVLFLVLFLGVFAGLVNLIGCGRVSDPAIQKNGADPIGGGGDQLNAAVSMMQPDRLGINAQPGQAAGLLNQWRTARIESEDAEQLSEPLSEESRAFLEKHLSGEALQRVERDDFTVDDVKHFRTSRLMKGIVDHLVRGVDGELNRAQVVFDYVARNVELVSEDEALPLMPYEILVFGRGTAADRAWIFAELLRPLSQDAVIVKFDSSDPNAPWFVAAVSGETLHLFDPLHSTAVPRANREQDLPATLADLSNPSVWQALTGDAEIPISGEALKSPRIEVIGNSALWAPRHAKLENALTGDDSVVIYQQIAGPSDDSSAILNRLSRLKSESGQAFEVGVWNHPENRLEAYQDTGSLDELWRPFQAPVPIAVNKETGEVTSYGNPSKLQLKTRTQQLLGDYEDAIRRYSMVRLADRHLPSAVSIDMRDMHEDAAEDAYFWTGVCQMEQEGPADAATKFSKYIEETEQFTRSRHADFARILMGRCRAQTGRHQEALAAIEPLKATSPEYPTAMFLKRQWEAAGSAESNSAPAQNSENDRPTESKPAVAEKPGQ